MHRLGSDIPVRPQIPGGEMSTADVWNEIPDAMKAKAKREGRNIRVKMVPTIEFNADGQVLETYSIPSVPRMVPPRPRDRRSMSAALADAQVMDLLYGAVIVSLHKVTGDDECIILDVVRGGRKASVRIDTKQLGRLDWSVLNVESGI